MGYTVGFFFTNIIKNHKMLGLFGFLMETSEWGLTLCIC